MHTIHTNIHIAKSSVYVQLSYQPTFHGRSQILPAFTAGEKLLRQSGDKESKNWVTVYRVMAMYLSKAFIHYLQVRTHICRYPGSCYLLLHFYMDILFIYNVCMHMCACMFAPLMQYV